MARQPLTGKGLKVPSGVEGPPLPPFAGLNFAVYARKSSEDARTEDHKSTARQVEQATRYVAERGGTVLADQVFVDEDASGAEFRNRPGLLRLLDAVEHGQPFNALVMSDRDRLGREQFRRSMVLQQMRDKGIRVFAYLDDEEIRLDDATGKLMESVKGYAAEMERERARLRARDAAERKARQGHVTGGEPYGYENVHYRDGKEVPRGEPHDYVGRRVKPAEAEVVRAIFTAYAAGWGTTKIAKALNLAPGSAELNRKFFGGRRVPPPRQRTGSWSPMMVRELLYRRAYHGELVWGKTTHVDRAGRAGVTVRCGPERLLVVPAPGLQIVPDELWDAVHQRLAAMGETYLRDGRGKLWAKPDLGREGKYLLTGLAKCGCCGWNLVVRGYTPRLYGCSHYHQRGTCANGLAQPVAAVDAAFLAALQRETLTPERFAYAVTCGVERLRAELAREPDRGPALQRERAALQRKIERLVAAIGDGRGPAALVQEIARAEARIREIEAEAARLQAAPALAAVDWGRLEGAVAMQLTRFGDLLQGNVPRARQALKKLLVDQVVFTPVADAGGRRTYAFRGELAYGAVLQEAVALEYTARIPSEIRHLLEGRNSQGCATG